MTLFPTPAYGDYVEVLSAVMVSSPYSSEPTPDWTAPSARGIPVPVLVYAAAANDTPTPSAPAMVLDTLVAILPYGDPITRDDRLKVLTGPYAGTYEIDGRPAHWRTPWSGWEAGCEVHLKEVTGG